MRVYDAVGCTRCFGTGYLGRVGLYEVLTLDEELGEMIERNVPVRELREAARAKGVESVRQNGVRKVLDGETSLSELMRVVA